jgi:D-cysteine desulfhydrase
MQIFYPPTVSLAALPTPIQHLKRLTKEFGGPEIFVKRDDLTGAPLSGNKVRKLEFVLREALDRGADTVITCGGVQSNHCRATAVAAAQLGLKAILLLRVRNEAENALQGNLFLDRLLGAEVRFVTPEEYKRADSLMAGVVRELEGEGRKAYVIPEGASNALGAFGYVRAVEEICGQSQRDRVDFDYVVHAAGSGGTSAGLLAGKKIFGLRADVLSVNICDDREYFLNRISRICADMQKKFSVPPVSRDEINIVDGYVGRGYALSTPEEMAFIAHVARAEGLVLDHVYTGKAFFALANEIKKGRFKKGEKVLFIHTGGIFGLFAIAGEFRL